MLMMGYNCPKCGIVLSDQVESIEIIDTDRDDVWTEMICSKCNSGVKPELHDGNPVYYSVDPERWLWYAGYYDQEAWHENI